MKQLVILALIILPAGLAVSAPVVQNPAAPPATRTVTFTEVWRAGADDGAEYIFGVIGDAVCDPGGNVYLLDTQQQAVFKFGPAGEYLGTVSRRGEGPGEIDRVRTLALAGPDRLALLKGFPPAFILVDTEGVPLPGLQPQPPDLETDVTFGFVTGFAWRDGHLVCRGQVSHTMGGAQDWTNYLVSLHPDGTVRHCYGTRRGGYDFSRPITVDEVGDRFAQDLWALGADGEIYLAPYRDRWLIEVRDPDGAPVRTVTRPWAPHRRTPAEMEEAKAGFRFSSSGELPPINYRIADHDPAITGLRFLGGELRVSGPGHGRDLPEGVVARFDVLDPEGRLLEERSLALPLVPDEDLLIHLEDGRVVRVKAYRSAHAAGGQGLDIQVGEEKVKAGDTGEDVLEVIVYRPDPD